MKAIVVETHKELAQGAAGTVYYNGLFLLARCPGCGEIIGMNVSEIQGTDGQRVGPWNMTGYPDAITLSPSVVHLRGANGCGWHGWLQNGEWRSV